MSLIAGFGLPVYSSILLTSAKASSNKKDSACKVSRAIIVIVTVHTAGWSVIDILLLHKRGKISLQGRDFLYILIYRSL
jgi:hypothetical protein